MPSLYKRWQIAVKESEAASTYFSNICETVGEERTKEWTQLEDKLQIERDADISVMDQFDVHQDQGRDLDLPYTERHLELSGPSKADMTNLWIRKETETKGAVFSGAARWIASGLALEEQQ